MERMSKKFGAVLLSDTPNLPTNVMDFRGFVLEHASCVAGPHDRPRGHRTRLVAWSFVKKNKSLGVRKAGFEDQRGRRESGLQAHEMRRPELGLP